MRHFLLISLCCLITAAVLIACDSPSSAPPAPAASSAPIPTPTTGNTYKPQINITRSDYDAAMVKWQAQGISEYQITTNEVSLRSENGYPETYQVNGDNITVLQTIWDSHPTPVIVHRSDLPADNTVEGLFALADQALDAAAHENSIGTQTIFDIRFDLTLGYVAYYQTDCHVPLGAYDPLHQCPSDTYVQIKVSDFKVLRRGHSPLTPTATVSTVP